MNYVTKEIKYSKKLRKILKKEVSFKEIDVKNKIKKRKKKSNPSLIGNAYELLFQIEFLIKEKNIFDFYNLKYSRTKTLIRDNVQTEIGTKVLKSIYKHEKNIIMYMDKKKVSGLYESILYLTDIAYIREVKDIYKFEKRFTKRDQSELKDMHKKMDKKIFKKINGCEFNVVVQNGYLLGEVDILTKDNIIDIKTTIFPTITKEMIYQQIIYKIMIEKSLNRKIKTISIYLSKYNYLVNFKYKKLMKNENKLKKYLEKRYKNF